MPEHLALIARGNCFVVLDHPKVDFVIKIPRKIGWPVPAPGEVFSLRAWRRSYIKRLRQLQIRTRTEKSKTIVQKICADPSLRIDDFLPETYICTRVDVTWSWNERLMRYRGWSLVQRNVGRLYNNRAPLNTIDWAAIVNIQEKLWRQGIGLGMPAEAWGPRGWCITPEGKTRLGDVSDLVDDKEIVLAMLEDSVRQARRRVLMDKQPPETKRYVDEYLSFVSNHLNQETLSRTWRRNCWQPTNDC